MICKKLSSINKNASESQWPLDFSVNGLQMSSIGEKTTQKLMMFCDSINVHVTTFTALTREYNALLSDFSYIKYYKENINANSLTEC